MITAMLQNGGKFGIAVACLMSTQTLAQNSDLSLAPFEVVYEVGNNLITAGRAKLSLTRDGDEWIYSLKTSPTGIFKLTGKGKIHEVSVLKVFRSSDDIQLQPRHYTFRQDKEARRSVDAWFNWTDNELTYRRRGKEVTEEFSDPILDRLSVTLSVMNELRKGFDQAQLQVFDNGRIKTMVFINEGEESLDTALGPMQTIRVRSQNLGGGSRHSITWFAPELDYVPVKIEQIKRDKLVARLTLSSLHNRATDNAEPGVPPADVPVAD